MDWPASPVERDRFVLQHRGQRPAHDPSRAQGFLVEQEPEPGGQQASILTIFLTGRECPWRCAMCDLWKHTISFDTPPGAIVNQIAKVCEVVDASGASPDHVKLYNSGSFFDPRAVPESDYGAIAGTLQRFRRVIVECHPSLIGPRVDRFLAELESHRGTNDSGPALEVAMGLETAHAQALEQLHKRMDLAAFARGADYLRGRGVALRVFLLVAPPFIPAEEQERWLLHSIDVALSCGASVISLIPTRRGNGTMEALEHQGLFTAPSPDTIQRSASIARTHVGDRARLLLDPWSD